MITEEFKNGFVKACLDRNCSAEETDQLFKLAAITQEFDDNKDFTFGFNEVAPHIDTNKVPLMAKAELVMSKAAEFTV